MKLLRETIRRILLQEGMNTYDMLPQNVGIKILERQDSYGSIDIMYCDLETGTDYVFLQPSKEGIYGSITIGPLYPYEPDYDWREIWKNTKYGDDYIRNLDCDGAYYVILSKAAEGWGPLLYDVAIEVATIKGSGLVSDRTSVSLDAQEVWEKYMNSRPDVKKFQCDDQYNTLTPDSKDNIDMEIIGAEDYLYSSENLVSNPLGKRYSKTPTTIQALEKSAKIMRTKRKPMRKYA